MTANDTRSELGARVVGVSPDALRCGLPTGSRHGPRKMLISASRSVILQIETCCSLLGYEAAVTPVVMGGVLIFMSTFEAPWGRGSPNRWPPSGGMERASPPSVSPLDGPFDLPIVSAKGRPSPMRWSPTQRFIGWRRRPLSLPSSCTTTKKSKGMRTAQASASAVTVGRPPFGLGGGGPVTALRERGIVSIRLITVQRY